MAFTLDTTGSDNLCTDEMIEDLLAEVTEFPGSIYEDSFKLAEIKIYAKEFLEFQTGKKLFFKDIINEKHDGNDKYFIVPNRNPLISVSSLTIDGTAQVLETDFWVYPEHIGLRARTPRGEQNILLSYRHGIGNEKVSAYTAWVVAKVCALHIMGTLGSGASQGNSITVGPIGLKETFYAGGKYSPKTAVWERDVADWINQKRGPRLSTVGHQLHLRHTPKIYVPRRDSWE